jgi:uncharacterized protein (TIGR02145 family)
MYSCKKQEKPTLTTSEVTNITGTSATSGGTIIDEGSGTVTERGVCWSKDITPSLSDSKTSDGAGAGKFISNISGLNGGTIYYVRAYATNSVGTGYGMTMSCTTLEQASDVEGNFYNSITIGTQVWMAENLKTTKYNDGTSVPLVTDNTTWMNLSTAAYSWYNNDVVNKSTYGALYNWYAVNAGNLCPAGWHVPSDAEWTTLTTYLGGENVAGGKLKETGITHWISPNAGATNETGFTALPGGYRGFNGTCVSIGGGGEWWSSSVYSTVDAWHRNMNYSSSNVGRSEGGDKRDGFSVRCIKN